MMLFCCRLSLGLLFLECFVATVAKTVTYGKYGSFSDGYPFDSKVIIVKRPLPNPPEDIQMEYFLFTREDQIGFKRLDDSDVNKLKDSTYERSRKTILITHGWTGRPLESVWVRDMKDALLAKEDVNVIIVGWKEGADDLFYPQAVGNTRLAGAMVAEFIKFLIAQSPENTPDTFHVIGFSLGAQVAGYAGKRFQEITSSKIGRITGLDPASPGYKDTHIDVRLDATDGEFVDVIHSDCPNIGTPTKSGKVDFWPNGGGAQPGCLIKRGGLTGAFFRLVGCEHYRAHQYFIESIKSSGCLFRSYPSNNWKEFKRGIFQYECGPNGRNCPEMGYNAIKYKDSESGNFYLYTNERAPYCVHRYMSVRFQTGIGTGWLKRDGENVRIRINGAKGTTGEIKFDGHLKEGSTEQFIAPIKADLGELQTIEIKDGKITSFFDSWKVVKVTVQYLGSTQSHYACYNAKVSRSFIKRPLTLGNAPCIQNDPIGKRPLQDKPQLSGKSAGDTMILKLQIEPTK